MEAKRICARTGRERAGYTMKELRKKFERFVLKNRNRGIPNLMLVIAIGNLIAYGLSVIDPSRVVYRFLCFSPSAVLHGQLWRLFTYVFTYLLDASGMSLLLSAVSLFCYYQFGKILEQHWGTFRFNLYYLTGILLTDLAALLLGYPATATALNLSLFLAVATIAPELRVLLMYFIPIKMKWMAWVYLGMTALEVVSYLSYGLFRFYWVLPLVPLANYFLFFGREMQNLLPDALRYRRPKAHRHASGAQRPGASWASSYQSKTGQRPYRHKCAVCGRTDTEYPNLEFRYCSKCNGYYCYCMEHINNHAHVQ